ncbi:hypothetical protein M3J07_010501 [Ascochyta lentis]
MVGQSTASRSKKHMSFLYAGINGDSNNQMWLMSWSGQCLPLGFGFTPQVLASSAVCTTKLRAEHPRASSKHNIDAAACPDARLLAPPLCRCGAFSFAIYPRLPGLTK